MHIFFLPPVVQSRSSSGGWKGESLNYFFGANGTSDFRCFGKSKFKRHFSQEQSLCFYGHDKELKNNRQCWPTGLWSYISTAQTLQTVIIIQATRTGSVSAGIAEHNQPKQKHGRQSVRTLTQFPLDHFLRIWKSSDSLSYNASPRYDEINPICV